MDLVKLEKEICKFNESFCGEARGMTEVQLKDSIARESIRKQEIVNSRENDEELNQLKAELKEMKAPYAESLKVQKHKLDFLVATLEEKTAVENA